jgi:L-malate glycosyltransferase
MKVLYIKDRFGVHDRRFLQAIIAQGHLPLAVQLGSYENKGIDLGVALRCVAEADLQGLISSEKVDVVHVGPIPFAASLVEILPANFPFVVVSWGSDILLDCALSTDVKAKALAALKRASVVLVDCQAVAKTIASWLPDLPAAVITFPWGLDLPRFEVLPLSAASELRKSLGWLDNDVFVSTRSWEANYGIQSLVEAFALVMQKAPMARLLLVGDGSLRLEVMGMIASFGLTNHIHAPGRVDEHELPLMYGAADVYVSSSFCDGSSISLLEAMASGKPVIAHNEFGNLDWVLPDENGWLVNCRDPAKFAEAILVTLSFRNRWQSMGQLGRELVFDKADWACNSLLLSKAYHLALEGLES